jgi:hypothetical protein
MDGVAPCRFQALAHSPANEKAPEEIPGGLIDSTPRAEDILPPGVISRNCGGSWRTPSPLIVQRIFVCYRWQSQVDESDGERWVSIRVSRDERIAKTRFVGTFVQYKKKSLTSGGMRRALSGGVDH